MELYVYDTEMTPLGVIDRISSLVWTRRYWSVGEFSLLVPLTDQHRDLLQPDRILMPRGGNEAAQIRYIHISKSATGLEQMEIQGKFLLQWLNRRIIYQQFSVEDAYTTQIILDILDQNVYYPVDEWRKIPNLYHVEEVEDEPTQWTYTTEEYDNVLTAVTALAQADGLGLRVETDVRTGEHYLIVYQGKDLTEGNTNVAPCIFSTDFDNILEQEYTYSSENLCNAVYVGGEDTKDVPRTVVEVGTEAASYLDRREVFISATDLKQTYKDADKNEITLTDEQYQNALGQRGREELETRTENRTFTSKINPASNLVYREDFNLGDLVTCINERWGVKIDTRITEITETWQQGKKEITVTFGNSLPTILEQIRKMR